jgi:ABC-type polysaccharide/polyol phosphate transport system ATPase subunit
MAAVTAERVSKAYRLGEHLRLGTTLAMITGRHGGSFPFEALQAVSFEVGVGECFGIVGKNGSGKSTLLQILAGITLPTAGRMTVRGRVLPLLTVGAGFHLELTGYENTLLMGTILGFDPRAIKERMDDVSSFAELDHEHMATPIKRYSQGMASRLSFAIGMVFPAEIYCFDEVLAVVDGEFRERCLYEIAQFVKDGRTVLYVSHDLDQVRALCDRTMWLERGRLRQIGPTSEVLDAYERHTAE